jgi:creatinine amidohydrolase
MRTVLWQHLRREEIEQARDAGAVVVLPVGSIEQHGPHLPVDTDILCAYSVAVRAAESIKEFPVLVAPPLAYGLSPHHMAFPASITLSLDIFTSVVKEICRCLWVHGFRHILILNGHGGNVGALTGAVVDLCAEGIIVGSAPYWELGGKEMMALLEGERKEMGHACETETSLVLHLRPDSVAIKNARKDDALVGRGVPGVDAVFFAAVFPKGSSGTMGDPTLATAEKGNRLLEVAAAKTADFLRKYRAKPVA